MEGLIIVAAVIDLVILIALISAIFTIKKVVEHMKYYLNLMAVKQGAFPVPATKVYQNKKTGKNEVFFLCNYCRVENHASVKICSNCNTIRPELPAQ